MGNQSFSRWLTNETAAAVFALLTLLERRDKLLYSDAPALRREYMSKIGTYEEKVLEAELTADLLDRKIQLMQTAINQRKPINMEEIDALLQAERDEKISGLEKTDKTSKELPELDANEEKEMQLKYRSIIRAFHPQVNSSITETQRELYEEAVEAYRRRDIDAIRIVFDMLNDNAVDYGSETMTCTKEASEADNDKAIAELSDTLSSDYSLAGQLYSYFTETETNAVIRSTCERYRNQRVELEDEIRTIQNSFPFNACETMNSPEMTAEYLAELNVRLQKSEESIKESTEKINSFTGGTVDE